MNALSLVLRLTAIAGAAAAVALFLVIGNTKQKLEENLAQTRATLAATEAERARWEGDAARFEARASALDSDLNAERTRATQAASQLAQARRELTQQGTDLQAARRLAEDRDREATQLRRDLLEAHAATAAAEGAARTLAIRETELDQLRTESERLRADLAAVRRERDAVAAGAGGSLATGATRPGGFSGSASGGPAVPTRSLPGEILAVDLAAGVLGLDYGSQRGATLGADVMVQLTDGTLTRLVLSTVEPEYSVGRIIAGATQARGLRPGEPAIILLP